MNSKSCKVVTIKILRVFRELRGKNFSCGEARLCYSVDNMIYSHCILCG